MGYLLSQRFRSTSKLLIASMLALGYCEHMRGTKQIRARRHHSFKPRLSSDSGIFQRNPGKPVVQLPLSNCPHDQRGISKWREPRNTYTIRRPCFLITLPSTPLPPSHTHACTHTHTLTLSDSMVDSMLPERFSIA